MPSVLGTLAGSEPESSIAVHKKEMTGIDQIPATPIFDKEPFLKSTFSENKKDTHNLVSLVISS